MNLEEMETVINELREKVEGIYKSVHGIEPNDADTIWANLEINQNGIKRLNEQLAELRNSYVEIEAYSDANKIHIAELKEVLWELLTELVMEDAPHWNPLLEKLEVGSARQTEKKKCMHQYEIREEFEICKLCGYISAKRIKASGGEKEPLECHSEKMGVDSSEDNSKQPEPWCDTCKSKDDGLNKDFPLSSPCIPCVDKSHYKRVRDATRNEPREDEPNNPILRALFFVGNNEECILDWKFRYKREYFDIVKREDLTSLILYCSNDDLMLRMREEYNL